jgi:hypothetical protein
MMNDGGERDDWIKELFETSEQLGRLSRQLEDMKDQNFQGIIGRIKHTQSRLDVIKDWFKDQE